MYPINKRDLNMIKWRKKKYNHNYHLNMMKKDNLSN